MKKVLSLVLVVLMLAGLSVFAFATETDSSNPPAPTPTLRPSQQNQGGPAFDTDSIEVEGLEDTSVFIELISEYTEVPEDATDDEKAEFEAKKAALADAVKALEDQEALEKAVAEAVAVATNKTVAEDVYDRSEDAIPAVSDAFHFDAKNSEGKSVLASAYKEGETPAVKIRIKFQLPDNLIKVLQRVGDTWVEVPVVINEKGEAALEISYAGPIIFIYNSNIELG